jgi:hypothetical protein
MRASTDEDQPPASPEDSLRLIREQRAQAERSLTPDPRLMYWPWAVAWLVGFGLLYLQYGTDGVGLLDLPGWLPFAALFGLMAVALATMSTALARANRHVAGESATKGMRYGIAWAVGFAGFGATAGYISNYLEPPQVGVLWAAGSMGLVAVMYVAGSALYNDRDMFRLGLWLGVVNVAGVAAGPGWHALAIAVAGGGGGLVAGQMAWRRLRRRA